MQGVWRVGVLPMTIMPCISIRQPWAGLILVGGKDVENRVWRCPGRWIGSKVLIHAGMTRDDDNAPYCLDLKSQNPEAFRLGGIVGLAQIVACVCNSNSRWANHESGTWHWLLAAALPLPFHPCKGRLGVFKVEYPCPIPEVATC